tara:strand:+ start:2062 stop:2166 length:105 start_codon:yes stop_codon:yes gene_type:complete
MNRSDILSTLLLLGFGLLYALADVEAVNALLGTL